MLHLSITFDYELFMGENYKDEREILINPTQKLALMLNELGISATFFADVCCPMRYRQLEKTEFPKMFDNQLVELISLGHDVQLHIHPNWLTATDVGSNVVFDRNSYRIHNWSGENEDYGKVAEIINYGKEYLNNVLLPEFPEYKCIAFRAGGYCLQPEKNISDILYDAGIRIDSSACMGFSYCGGGMYYDYRDYPKNPNMYFNTDFGFTDEKKDKPNKGIFEVPVFGYRTFPYRAIASKLNSKISHSQENGTAMKLDALPQKKHSPVNRIKRNINGANMLSFDSFNSKSMLYMIKRIKKEYRCWENDIYITIIAHPKIQSDEHINSMKDACEKMLNEKDIIFQNLYEVYKELNL